MGRKRGLHVACPFQMFSSLRDKRGGFARRVLRVLIIDSTLSNDYLTVSESSGNRLDVNVGEKKNTRCSHDEKLNRFPETSVGETISKGSTSQRCSSGTRQPASRSFFSNSR